MTPGKLFENILRKSLFLPLAMAVTSFAWGQKPKPPSPPPAPKPAAPAQHAPAAQRPAPAQHAAPARGASVAARPGATQHPAPAQRPTVTQHPGPQHPTKSSTPTAATHPTQPTQKPSHPIRIKEPLRQPPAKTFSLKNGGKAQVRRNGQIRSVDKNGMHIERNLHGGRTTVSEKNGKRVVTNGQHGGYVQRPLANRNGHSYYSRTTYDHGVARSGVYRGYSYGSHTYYGYQPAAYYSPGFYAWAGGDWASPVAWDAGAWGWAGAPWLGYYGFSPYGFYPGPAFWLTDYLLAANLQAAYAGLAGDRGISVAANQPWNDTGMQVVAGQTYAIAAGGVASFSNGNPSASVTPAGHQDQPGGAESIAPGLPFVSLVGKIGPEGAPFEVGPRRTLVAPVSGELYLGMNDESWGFGDNSGSWAVSITPANGDDSPATPSVATGSDPVALTPEVKQAIQAEVKEQLDADKDAANPNPRPRPDKDVVPALDPSRRNFVVSADLAVTPVGDPQECSLTGGDVIVRITDTPDADQKVNVSVTTAKKSDCPAGKLVAVSVDDLQEMRNHFEESLGAGLKTMTAKQGTHGMPKAPNTATVANSLQAPPPDASAAADLQAQQNAADQAEAEARAQASSAGGQP